MAKREKAHIILFLLFFLSGAASLIYQVVWQKMLTLVFGNTVYSTATVLASFLGGLAVGSYIAGRWADRVRSPLKLYAILEGLVGLFACITPFGFRLLDGIYVLMFHAFGDAPLLFAVARFLFSFLLLLIPTALMGATLPVLSRYFVENLAHLGLRVGLLYAVNTLGAVVGCFGSGFFLILEFGLRKTIYLTALGNFLVCGLALLISMGEKSLSPAAGEETRAEKPRLLERTLLVIIFLCGLTSIGFEVLWTRILVFHLGSSVYAYSLMLTLFLIGFSIGSLIAARLADTFRGRLLLLAAVEVGLGFCVLVQVKQFVSLSDLIAGLGAFFKASTYWEATFVYFISVLQILILPTCLMGMTFPLVVKEYVANVSRVGSDIGRIYASNTVGCIAGALLTGFALIPMFGTQRSMVVLAYGNLLAAALTIPLLAGLKRKSVLAVVALAILTLFPVATLFFEKDSVILSAGILKMGGAKQVLYFHEDSSATVTVEQVSDAGGGSYRSLSVNGVNVAGTSPDLVAIQKMQGHLPLLLHSDPHSVLHIGFGSGGTAWSVSTHSVDRIVIAEISQAVIKASERYFPDNNHGISMRPDVRENIRICDGRNFLLGTREKFDVILSDSIHPRYAGNGSLYTLDYYRLCRERLKPGGVLSQWLPIYSLTPETFKMILRSFQDVFPHTTVWYVNSVINPYTIVIGTMDPFGIDHDRLEKKLQKKGIRDDLKDIGLSDVYQLYDYFLFEGRQAETFADSVPFHTDDYPAVEYLAGKVLDREQTWLQNFDELLHFRERILPYVRPGKSFDEERMKGLYETTGLELEKQLESLRKSQPKPQG